MENYLFFLKEWFKKKQNMETKEYMENKKNSHDSSILGDEQHCVMTPRSSAWAWWAKAQGPTLWACSKMWHSMLHKGKKPQFIQKAFS